MKYQIEQVKANDYDELLALLNRVFNKTEGRTFDISLPAMWERDDEHASADMYVDRGNVRRFFKTISAYKNLGGYRSGKSTDWFCGGIGRWNRYI